MTKPSRKPHGGGILWKLRVLSSPRHLRAWRDVLRHNRAPWHSYLKMPAHLARILYEWARGTGVDQDLWIDRRITCSGIVASDHAQCRKRCPIYDPNLQRCRPYDGSQLGCACYLPFLALLRRPYKRLPGCWARQFQIEDARFNGPLGWL